MKPAILLLEPMMGEIEAALDSAYAVHRASVAEALALAESAAAEIRAIVTGGGTGAPPALVARLPNLGIVAVNGVGTDKIDLADARARGVRVTITAGTLADDVADQAIALLLAVSKKVVRNDRFVRAGGWLSGGKRDRLCLTLGDGSQWFFLVSDLDDAVQAIGAKMLAS